MSGTCPTTLPTLASDTDTSFYANENVPHGAVDQANYDSGGGQKRMHVYTPPDYASDTTASYPVLYLNHGMTVQKNVSGLSGAHHDFTVLPGKIAALVWASSGSDPESNLVERASDGSGSNTTVFRIGSNLYAGGQSALGGGSGSYHVNSIAYHPSDDSYTLGDRNPNLYVKVTHSGTPVWQIGGSCVGAKAPRCASGTWRVNHGHDFDPNGNLLIFNNGQSGASHVFEFELTESGNSLSLMTVKDFNPGTSSMVLGDVQRLPNGNTLITYSASGRILEVDSSWQTVQTLEVVAGYADWRETLYGPPSRI